MNEKIITPENAIYIGNFSILIQFDNDELKIADFKNYLTRDLKSFSEIKDEEYFKKFELDIFGEYAGQIVMILSPIIYTK